MHCNASYTNCYNLRGWRKKRPRSAEDIWSFRYERLRKIQMSARRSTVLPSDQRTRLKSLQYCTTRLSILMFATCWHILREADSLPYKRWLKIFNLGEPSRLSRLIPKSICRVGRLTKRSLQISNFEKNKLASGFNCTGVCLIVDRELSKCGTVQQPAVSINRRSDSYTSDGYKQWAYKWNC